MGEYNGLLRCGERLEDLQYHGLHLIQSDAQYRFSADSVLLSHFFRGGVRDRAVELCAGSGVMALLAAERTGAAFTCVEKNPVLCDMARRSFRWNNRNIPVWELDVRSAPDQLGKEAFHAVLCNPPYDAGGTQSGDANRSMARGSGGCTVEEVAQAAYRLLFFGGRLFVCYPAAQLSRLLAALRDHRLEPKRLRPVAANPAKGPYLVLVEAKKNAAPGLIWEPTLYLQGENGEETEEIRRIYHGED